MITGVTMHNFRGFRDLSLDGLARVNVLVGDNGSGKTALLEALFLVMSSSPLTGLQLRGARGLSGQVGTPGLVQSMVPEMFADFFAEGAEEVSITTRGGSPYTRSVVVRRDPRRGMLLAPSGAAVPPPDAGRLPAALPPSNVVPAPIVFNRLRKKGLVELGVI